MRDKIEQKTIRGYEIKGKETNTWDLRELMLSKKEFINKDSRTESPEKEQLIHHIYKLQQLCKMVNEVYKSTTSELNTSIGPESTSILYGSTLYIVLSVLNGYMYIYVYHDVIQQWMRTGRKVSGRRRLLCEVKLTQWERKIYIFTRFCSCVGRARIKRERRVEMSLLFKYLLHQE